MSPNLSTHYRAAPAAAADVREHNLALVLAEIRRHQPTSRTSVAAATGLASGSMTSLVAQLIELGWISESQTPAGRRGRPTTWLEIDGRAYAVIAIEIRIDEYILTSTDLGERTLAEQRWPDPRSQAPTPAHVADVVASAIETEYHRLTASGLKCVGVAIVIPAPLIGSPPVIMVSTDFGWFEPVDLVSMLRERTHVPPALFAMFPDVHVAASAEYEALPQNQPSTLLYLKADTGVGGALIADGKTFRGGHGVGFTPGHIVVQPDGALCSCGRRGCLVAEVGPEATVIAAGQRTLMNEQGLPAAFHQVIRLARAGDQRATDAVARASLYLQRFTLDLAVTFDPDQIIYGGLWADAFDLLRPGDNWDMHVPRLLGESRGAAPLGAFIVPSHYGERAARVGAIKKTINKLSENPSHLARHSSARKAYEQGSPHRHARQNDKART
jgi:predicted NBD/HSP70 family sugar kinase